MEKTCLNCKHNCQRLTERCSACMVNKNRDLWEPRNPYWERITRMSDRQREKGVKTYGQGLEQFTTPDALQRIEYIQEELIDALMYLEWLKDILKGENKVGTEKES